MFYTDHLDLYWSCERLMRFAGLPLAYTQGFSPRPRINLASALPLGFTSDAEVVDVWLERQYPLDEILSAIQEAAPPGIEIRDIQTIDDHAPTLQVTLEASEFLITLLEPVSNLENRLEALLSAPELPRQRRDKAYDLRPLILELRPLPPDEMGRQRLQACLVARESATGRPEEILAELGLDPLKARYHRTRLIFST